MKKQDKEKNESKKKSQSKETAKSKASAAKWRDVTDTFSERERHYNNTYLEQDEVFGDDLEVSIFSSEVSLYEIYFSYDIFYGIVYADKSEVYETRDRMKKDLEKAYLKSPKVSDEFIDWFAKKYDVQMPPDTLINFDVAAWANALDEISKITSEVSIPGSNVLYMLSGSDPYEDYSDEDFSDEDYYDDDFDEDSDEDV